MKASERGRDTLRLSPPSDVVIIGPDPRHVPEMDDMNIDIFDSSMPSSSTSCPPRPRGCCPRPSQGAGPRRWGYFGLWRVCFPPYLVRPGRRLPVQGLSEGSLGYLWCGSFFGLWRIRFPPVLVRTGRRLPVQALGERGVLVSLTGYPRGGAPGPG